PPRDLFQRFQEGSRLIYVTGEEDKINLDLDRRSFSAMRDLCMANTDSITMRGLGHETADPASLSRALEFLRSPPPPDAQTLQSCRTAVEKDVAAGLDRVETLLAQGRQDQARTLLVETDRHFGGLAAPRSLELAARLEKAP